MVQKILAICVGSAALILGGYYWGFICGQQDADNATYDQVLPRLTENILVRDAIVAKSVDTIRPLIDAAIVADFVRMIELYEKHGFENGEYLRCVVSRRIRKLKQDGQILSERAVAENQGWPMARIEQYLSAECLGEPSHADWNPVGSDKIETLRNR